jgi:Tol biopolymer transport system component
MGVAVAVGAVALAAPADATFPGPNGRIAFQRGEGAPGDFNLWTANPDGSRVLQLTNVPSFFSDWSPDGSRVAYDFEDADGNLQIATVNPDGTAVQQLTFGPTLHEFPSFSPDGSQIAYDYAPIPPHTPGFHSSLWVMNADGSDQHALAPASPDTLEEPKFSPDGQSIAFIRIRKVMGKYNQQNALFVMDADGSDVRQLTPWGQVPEFPSWSPDGQWIAFEDKSINPTGSRSILVIRPDGSGKRVIYQGQRTAEGAKPVFSPDGNTILFVCVDHKPAVDVGLCTVGKDGSPLVHITNTPAFEGFERNPSWGSSPPL